jgi:TIR domain
MRWDFFISYASEDRELVAGPLAHYLNSVGYRVWYDQFSLKVGDSLLAEINRGLAASDHGVVILSPSFFRKSWPQRELAGLVATSSGVAPRILPVWHQITADDVAAHSPILADVVSVDTKRGLGVVAEEIIRAGYPDRFSDHSAVKYSRSDSRLKGYEEGLAALAGLLAAGASRDDLFIVISAYPSLLIGLLGFGFVIPAARTSGSALFDFAVVRDRGMSAPISVTFIKLGSVDGRGDLRETLEEIGDAFGPEVPYSGRPLNYHPPMGKVAGSFPAALSMTRELSGMIETGNHHGDSPESWIVSVLLVHGRRTSDPANAARRHAMASTSRIPVEVASYDRLGDSRDGRLRS